MTDPKGDNALLAQMIARQQAEKSDKLAQAKREAAERGKQPFDLDKLEEIFDTRVQGGFQPPRDQRERDFEYRYYVFSPDTMSLAEFAARQAALDAGTVPRPPTDPAARAARANTLLARVPDDLDGLTPVGIAQARRDLEEAVDHLEAILAMIPDGDENVPDVTFETYTARRWSALYPERFRRAALAAAIARERTRLAQLATR